MDLLALPPATVAGLWDELPALVGPAWTDLYPQVAAAVADLDAAAGDRRPAAVVALSSLFTPYPRAAAALRRGLEDATRRGTSTEPVPPTWDDAVGSLRRRVDGPVVPARSEVFATRRLGVGGQGVVVAGLTADDPAAASEVEVHLSAPGLSVAGDPVRRVRVGDLATFRVVAVDVGAYDVRVEFRAAGRHLGGVAWAVEVLPHPPDDGASPVAVPGQAVLLGGDYVPPPDLELRVMLGERDGRTLLRYELHSANGAAPHHYDPVGEVVLTGSPDDQRRRLLRRIELLRTGSDEDALRSFGERLYRELLPAPLRAAFARLDERVRSLHVVTDEPWIPWELVRPFDDTAAPVVDDDFWGARFALSRWPAGPVLPAGRLVVERMVGLHTDDPGWSALPAVAAEHRWLVAFAAAHGIVDASPPTADRRSVGELLADPGIGLWHFAGHGDVDPDHPTEAMIVLSAGEVLRAEDLFGRRQAAVAAARPLVVLNACRVGAQGWSMAGLGGWAEAWVSRSRCGAFVGPQWAVTDETAIVLARTFYTALAAGRTLGAALQEARAAVRTERPGDPSWLAASLHGHPNARVELGRRPSPEQDGGAPG